MLPFCPTTPVQCPWIGPEVGLFRRALLVSLLLALGTPSRPPFFPSLVSRTGHVVDSGSFPPWSGASPPVTPVKLFGSPVLPTPDSVHGRDLYWDVATRARALPERLRTGEARVRVAGLRTATRPAPPPPPPRKRAGGTTVRSTPSRKASPSPASRPGLGDSARTPLRSRGSPTLRCHGRRSRNTPGRRTVATGARRDADRVPYGAGGPPGERQEYRSAPEARDWVGPSRRVGPGGAGGSGPRRGREGDSSGPSDLDPKTLLPYGKKN